LGPGPEAHNLSTSRRSPRPRLQRSSPLKSTRGPGRHPHVTLSPQPPKKTGRRPPSARPTASDRRARSRTTLPFVTRSRLQSTRGRFRNSSWLSRRIAPLASPATSNLRRNTRSAPPFSTLPARTKWPPRSPPSLVSSPEARRRTLPCERWAHPALSSPKI